jgi:hypothetical protein
MWHFDGNSWTSVKLITSEGGQIEGAIELTSIYGFSSADIYAVGSRIIGYNPNPPPNFIDSSLIIHYDGSSWKKENTYNGSILTAIYGTSSSDIWAGGVENTLYHKTGNTWQRDSINIAVQPDYIFDVSSISSYGLNTYAMGNSNNNNTGNTIFYFFKRLNDTWAVQDSFLNSGYTFGIRLNQSKLQNLYSYGGGGIYRYNGTSWDIFFQTAYPISSMWGNSDNNIFAVGSQGRAYHYNGTDWQQIEALNYPQTDYTAVWTDGTEAFVVGHIDDAGLQKTIVWHGK